MDKDVALLVVGDPLCATTHTDMMLRAREIGATVEVIHNASVMGAIASCGLQLYQFGQTVSVPYFDGAWRPDSFYDKIKYNQLGKMHTLVLVDIKVKEPDFEAMVRNQTAFLPPRFMTVNQCVAQLLEVEARRGEGVCLGRSLAIGVARLGQPSQQIVFGTLEELLCVDFGAPLHSVVLCGELHDLETAFLEPLRAPKVTVDQAAAAAAAATAEVAELVAAAKAPATSEDPQDRQGQPIPDAPAPALAEAEAMAPPPAVVAVTEEEVAARREAAAALTAAMATAALDDDDDDVFGLGDVSPGVAIVSDDEDE